jgi:murein DD-endopeptidase MepM/ murein hydrolase activator NlpD
MALSSMAFLYVGPAVSAPTHCVEHGADSLQWYLGDALGADCFIVDMIDLNGRSWYRAYKEDGEQNEDWYGWHQKVLSPCKCKVLEVSVNLETNRPGVMGAKPASLFTLQRDDGVIFHVVHFDKPLVKSGDSLVEGEVIAEVGNNGLSRQPHIHIGAYRGSEPLQVRFNQRFIP